VAAAVGIYYLMHNDYRNTLAVLMILSGVWDSVSTVRNPRITRRRKQLRIAGVAIAVVGAVLLVRLPHLKPGRMLWTAAGVLGLAYFLMMAGGPDEKANAGTRQEKGNDGLREKTEGRGEGGQTKGTQLIVDRMPDSGSSTSRPWDTS